MPIAPGVDEVPTSCGGSWTATAAMGTHRARHTATLLHDGRVLVEGGEGGAGGEALLAPAELYDPGTGR